MSRKILMVVIASLLYMGLAACSTTSSKGVTIPEPPAVRY